MEKKEITPQPTKQCKESKNELCRVEVYCDEIDYGNQYYEVEVWSESGEITLRKFNMNEDGTRTLMSYETVNKVVEESDVVYGRSDSKSKLKYNKVTKKGIYTLSIGGSDYKLDLNCQSYP